MRASSTTRHRMNAARHSHALADEPADDLPDEQRRSHRLRFEVILASLLLAFGLFLLPGLIFWIGDALLGPYGENAGLGTFYSDFYGDLAEPSGRAWSIALGPLILIYLLRAVFIGAKAGPIGEEADDEALNSPRHAMPPPVPKREPPKKGPRRTIRVEPRVSGE